MVEVIQGTKGFYGCFLNTRSIIHVGWVSGCSLLCFEMFSSKYSGFPLFQTPVRPGIIVDEGLRGCAPSKSGFIYLFIYLFNTRNKISNFFLREKVQPHRPRGSNCSFTDFERYYEVHSSQLAECFSSSSSRSEDWGMNLETPVSLNNEADASARQTHHTFE